MGLSHVCASPMVSMLQTNYRSHPSIVTLFSAMNYGMTADMHGRVLSLFSCTSDIKSHRSFDMM